MNATTSVSKTRLAKSMTSKLGQNTAEYMLLLLLIGGGSIIAFKTFGTGIMNRFASVTNIIGGKGAISAEEVKAPSTLDFTTFDNQGAGAPKE